MTFTCDRAFIEEEKIVDSSLLIVSIMNTFLIADRRFDCVFLLPLSAIAVFARMYLIKLQRSE